MFTSYNPTPHPPDIDTSIADSGLSYFYFAPGAPVMNYDATAPTIGVCMALAPPYTPLQVVNLHRSQPYPQPVERATSWQASHIPSLDWLPLLMRVVKCSLPTQQSLHLIGIARSSLKVGANPLAPNIGAGHSSHRYHRRLIYPKNSSS
jgi:hypothetical protein